MKKYPYQILLNNRPYAHDLENEFDNDKADNSMDWWEKKKPLEVIAAIQEIHDRYNSGSGWTWGECKESKIREQKALKKVINHAKKQYRKHYKKPNKVILTGNMVEIDISKEAQ